MKNLKINIIKFIAKILGVDVQFKTVKKINLSNNNFKEIDLTIINDLSTIKLNDSFEIDFTNCKNLENIKIKL